MVETGVCGSSLRLSSYVLGSCGLVSNLIIAALGVCYALTESLKHLVVTYWIVSITTLAAAVVSLFLIYELYAMKASLKAVYVYLMSGLLVFNFVGSIVIFVFIRSVVLCTISVTLVVFGLWFYFMVIFGARSYSIKEETQGRKNDNLSLHFNDPASDITMTSKSGKRGGAA